MPRSFERSESVHILVKWCGVQMWDVYPVHMLQDEALKQGIVLDGLQENKGRLVRVAWKEDESPAPALLIDVGTACDMEKARKKVENKHKDDTPSHVEQELLCVIKERDSVKRENNTLKVKVDQLSNLTGLAAEMQQVVQEMKKLQKKMRRTLSKEAFPDEMVELAPTSGVYISHASLNKAKSLSGGNGCRLARDLMRLLFTKEELQGRSLTGTQSNAHKEAPAKEQIDPARMAAILEYCRTACPATEFAKMKQSIRTFLQRL